MRLSLIVPIYNEEAAIDELRTQLVPVLDPLGTFEVILINDGSKDRSAEMLDELCASDPRFTALHFSRNFGHQAAVTAGLHASTGEWMDFHGSPLEVSRPLAPIWTSMGSLA